MRIVATLVALLVTAAPAFAQMSDAAIAADLERLARELRARTPVIVVPEGGDLAAAAATLVQTGGIVELRGTYRGPFELPRRPAGSPLITIRGAANLPARRIATADASQLATIVAIDVRGALRFVNTAGYRLEGVRLETTGIHSTSEAIVIHNSDGIELDRVLHVATNPIKRSVRGNGRHITVTRSHLDAGALQGQDNQAFIAWDGAGPYTLLDNTLMAGGENVIFGGSDNLGGEATNPCDIRIEGNLLYKPQEWRTRPGSVKNLFELKNACRVVFRRNVLDGNWPDAQSGYAIVLTPANQDGRAPWTRIADVLIEENVLINSARGVNLIGRGYGFATQQMTGIVFRRNVFTTYKQFLMAGGEVGDVTFDGNVIDNAQTVAQFYFGDVRNLDGTARPGAYAIGTLTWTNNVQRDMPYGVKLGGGGSGTAALEGGTLAYTFTGNGLVDLQHVYPAGTAAIAEAALQATKAALLAQLPAR